MGLRVTLRSVCTKPQVHTGASRGQVQPFSRDCMALLTILSSSEWKLMTAMRPPTFSRSGAVSISEATAPSSSLTAMRMAWKLRFAGCCFSRSAAAGMADLMMSTSSSVVFISCSWRRLAMARAIRAAWRSSP